MNIQVTDDQLIESSTVGLDVKEYAKVFAVSETTVRTRIRENKVACYKQNNKWIIIVDKNQLPKVDNNSDSKLITQVNTLTMVLDEKQQ